MENNDHQSTGAWNPTPNISLLQWPSWSNSYFYVSLPWFSVIVFYGKMIIFWTAIKKSPNKFR